MTYASTILAVIWLIWLIGLLVLVGRWMENIRVVHNNLTADATAFGYMKPGWSRLLRFRFSNIDPARLNATGRGRLNGAIWNERMMYAWMVVGWFLTAYVF